MTTTDLLERLAAHRTLGAAPRSELEWFASHGSLRRMEAGDILTAKGASVEGMFIVLSGRVAIFVDRGAGRHKVLEWRDGDVAGLLPYSRLVAPPGDSVVQEPAEILAIPRDQLHAMIRECHQATSILVHSMLDRSRVFTSSGLHDEKMLSLGKLSAGLAHELNNPASAIERSSVQLERRLEELERASRALGAAGLSVPQLEAVDALRTACVSTHTPGVRSSIEQAEREELMNDWLVAHGLDATIADVLADSAVTFDSLESVSRIVDGPALDDVLRWAATGCLVRDLTSDIREAATRISSLVAAIKGFSHMDQSMVAEPVDLVRSLDNTIAVLKSKVRGRSAAVVLDVERDLPQVRGFAGELNQIWSNLIDNALDAVPDSDGRIDVRANREDGGVAVRVIDNGAGIPEQVRDRIFDPFFTTKPVGAGTGLGLDIVRRLVRHNDAEITVESRPGRTEFRVLLPVVRGDGDGART